MKFVAAAVALPALASVASAGLVEKRGLSCNTVFGQGKIAEKIPTNTRVKNAGRVVTKTVTTKSTVTIDPTVSRTLTGLVVSTDSITSTKTAPPTTITVTGSSTSTVAAQAGFTAAAHALTTNAANKNDVKAQHTKRDAAPEPEAEPEAEAAKGKVPVSVDCVKDLAGKVQTITTTVAQRPYKTKYNAAKTITIDHRKTTHVAKFVATTTVQKRFTAEVPRATHWAACQEDNLLGWTFGRGGSQGISSNSSIGGNSTSPSLVGISSVTLVSGTTPKRFDTSTAAQCCISCQTTTGCMGSAWRAGVCTLQIRPGQSNTCSANQASFTVGTFFANPLSFLGIGEGLIISNGRCGGIWAFGGLTL